MEDSLTLKIADIISNNIRIRNQIDKETTGTDLNSYHNDVHTLLQYHCATYFDNESIRKVIGAEVNKSSASAIVNEIVKNKVEKNI